MEFFQNALLFFKQPFANNFSISILSDFFNGNCLNCLHCEPFGKLRKRKASKSPVPFASSESVSSQSKLENSSANQSKEPFNMERKVSQNTKFTLERINQITRSSKELTTISSFIEKFRDAQEKQTIAMENKYAATRFINKNQNSNNTVTYVTADINHEVFIPCEGFDKFYENNSTYNRSYYKNNKSFNNGNSIKKKNNESDDGYAIINVKETINPSTCNNLNQEKVIRPPPRRKRRAPTKIPPTTNTIIIKTDAVIDQDSNIYEDVCKNKNYATLSKTTNSEFVEARNQKNENNIITTQPKKGLNKFPNQNDENNFKLITHKNCENSNNNNEIINNNNNLSNINNNNYNNNNNNFNINNDKTSNIINNNYSKVNNLKNFNNNQNTKTVNKIYLKNRSKPYKNNNNKTGCSNIDLTNNDRLNFLSDHENIHNNNNNINTKNNKKYSLSYNNLQTVIPFNDDIDNNDDYIYNNSYNSTNSINLLNNYEMNEFIENKVYYKSGSKEITRSEFNLKSTGIEDDDDDIIICESIIHTINTSTNNDIQNNVNNIENNFENVLIPENSTYKRLYSESLYEDEIDKKSLSSIDIHLEQIASLKTDDKFQLNYQKIMARSPFVKLKSIYHS